MVITLTALLPFAFIWIGRWIYASGNQFASISFIAGFGLFVATLISYGRHPGLPSPFYSAIRNFYLPMVLLLWSLIAITRFDARRLDGSAIAFVWLAVRSPSSRNRAGCQTFAGRSTWSASAHLSLTR